MAVTTTYDNNSLSVKLNTGLDSSGKVKLVTLNITGVKKSAFSEEDKQKALNIVTALRPILEYPTTSVQLTSRILLEESA